MGLNLSSSAVHVVTGHPCHKVMIRNAATRSFRCWRCERTLPESAFVPVGGVGKRNVVYLHPYCRTCRAQLKSAFLEHPLYTAELHRFVTTLCGNARSSAERRGIAWAITEEDVLGMYTIQGGQCALSGLKMTYTTQAVSKSRTNTSIDRVDSSRNYTLDNIQLVCSAVNIAKNDLSTADFVTICLKVAAKAMATQTQ